MVKAVRGVCRVGFLLLVLESICSIFESSHIHLPDHNPLWTGFAVRCGLASRLIFNDPLARFKIGGFATEKTSLAAKISAEATSARVLAQVN